MNIGLSLVSHPRVLFIDEPTSGLDSFTANEVMRVVKSLTDDGTTICATIHSPTPYVYSLFDSLMILIRGQTVYFGSRGEIRYHMTGERIAHSLQNMPLVILSH